METIKLIIALFRKSSVYFNDLSKDKKTSNDIINLKYMLSQLDPILYNIFKIVINNSTRFELNDINLFKSYIINDDFSFESDYDDPIKVKLIDKNTNKYFVFNNTHEILTDNISVFDKSNYDAFVVLCIAHMYIYEREQEMASEMQQIEKKNNALKDYN